MNDTESSRDPQPESQPKTSFGRLFVPMLLVVAVIAVTAMLTRPSGLLTAPDHPAIGKPAPQIDLVRLTDDLSLEPLRTLPASKVTLVHFWGTWCGPCQAEYPHLSEAANRLQGDRQFEFIPISCEGGRNETFEGLWQKTKDYFASEGIDSFAYADPRGVTRMSAAERLGRPSMYFPTSILIDDTGSIVGVWEGYTKEAVHEIEGIAGQLLAASDQ